MRHWHATINMRADRRVREVGAEHAVERHVDKIELLDAAAQMGVLRDDGGDRPARKIEGTHVLDHLVEGMRAVVMNHHFVRASHQRFRGVFGQAAEEQAHALFRARVGAADAFVAEAQESRIDVDQVEIKIHLSAAAADHRTGAAQIHTNFGHTVEMPAHGLQRGIGRKPLRAMANGAHRRTGAHLLTPQKSSKNAVGFAAAHVGVPRAHRSTLLQLSVFIEYLCSA